MNRSVYNLTMRPREKLLELGPHQLEDWELLAIIIRTGTVGKTVEDLSKEIVNRFGSLMGMFDQPFDRFTDLKGLSEVKIIQIAAALEIARRIAEGIIDGS